MAVIPRSAQGHGWLRPAIGVVELSQCIIQVNYSAHHFKSFYLEVAILTQLSMSGLSWVMLYLKHVKWVKSKNLVKIGKGSNMLKDFHILFVMHTGIQP